MSQTLTIHSTANITVSPYQFERITEMQLVRPMNDHARITISGIVAEEMLDKYVEQLEAGDQIEVKLREKNKETIIFRGPVTNMRVEAVRDVRSLTIEAYSSTINMDVRKESRSFQNKQMSYPQLFQRVMAGYSKSDFIDNATGGKSIGSLLVQYQETDWMFLKRIASHFHAPLVPVSSHAGIKFYIGLPDTGQPVKLDEYNYTVHKDLRDYQLKAENGVDGIDEHNSMNYTVMSYVWVELGRAVQFHGRTLYVTRAESRIENDVVIHIYELKDRGGVQCRTAYCYELAGTSLFGEILDVANDKVKLRLQIDQDQPVNESMWFPYSTVYSSPDGSGWYCMPEVGDEVRLYFPDEREKNAFAASSVDKDSSDPARRSDPSVKSISTKYGKQVIFKPGSIEIIASGQLLMKLTDDGGIEINSDKKISLNAEEDIEITGGAKILLQGESGIEIVQANATMKIEDEVTLSGGRVNIE
ncbi:contractile injection system protein, VgrG/Pvc8 family [Paenibacillus solani]|uniref:contractile injection system protein, VgrG/Pvc8 family n=1 Tax=Paenibacillus solani TaxID=1705565 RepID=UPI003D2D7555